MALMPVSVRQGAAPESGNQVGGVPVALHSEIADPLARLAAVHDDASREARVRRARRGFLKSILDGCRIWPPRRSSAITSIRSST
jgi:uncharacterized metal-binding protein